MNFKQKNEYPLRDPSEPKTAATGLRGHRGSQLGELEQDRHPCQTHDMAVSGFPLQGFRSRLYLVTGKSRLYDVRLHICFSDTSLPDPTGAPFQVYLMTGILAWNFMSAAAIQASVTLLSGASLVNKVDVPRIVLPRQRRLCKCRELCGGGAALVLFVISGVSPRHLFCCCPSSFYC